MTIRGSSIVAQDSASSALKKLCKSEADMIIDLHPKLLEVFTSILQQDTYHKIFIYDTLAEFIDMVHDPAFMAAILSQVMPILQASFEVAKINDGSFVPLFECICSMVRSCGDIVMPYADALLRRVMMIAEEITRVLKMSSSRHKSKEKVKLEYELNNNLMRCFDFVGTLTEAIPEGFAKLTYANLLPELIFAYLETDNLFLKQMVYSVLGDLAATLDKSMFLPKIDQVIASLINDAKVLPASLDPGKSYLSIATNALYALSEIIEKFPERVDPNLVLQKLLKIYENAKVELFDSASQVSDLKLFHCVRQTGLPLPY